MNRFLQSHILLRRIIVAAMYGAYIAGAILQWQQHEITREPQASLILALFVASFALGALLFGIAHYGRWSSTTNKRLDEREIAARNAAYTRAYWIVAAVSAVWLGWQTGRQLEHPFGVDSNVLLWGYVLLITTLPATLLAWADRPPTE
jgi:magnesium-transporting ATPase (P-type)